MTNNSEPPEVARTSPDVMSKGQEAVVIFPKPREGETTIKQLRRLIEDDKSIGFLKMTADKTKAAEIAGIAPNSWTVTGEAVIEIGEFEPEPSLKIPGQSFKALLAEKEDGTYYVSLGDNGPIGPSQEPDQRQLEYNRWFERTQEELQTFLKRTRKTFENKRHGVPLTLTAEELTTTKFKFV